MTNIKYNIMELKRIANDMDLIIDFIMDREYSNYHKHCHYSNIMAQDSTIKPHDYINRAIDLGHSTIFCTQHGTAIGWYEYYSLVEFTNGMAKKIAKNIRDNDVLDKLEEACGKKNVNFDLLFEKIDANEYKELHFRFGVEAYFSVSEDATNLFHLMLIAKNKEGMEQINLEISKCSTDSIYGDSKTFRNKRPKISIERLLKLNSDNIMVTTACVGSYVSKHENYELITEILHKHFGDNFFLEVQYHHTDLQKTHNEICARLARENGIKLIAGMDSHMIYQEQEKDRDSYLHSKGIFYEDEEGWFLDYPDYQTAFGRFLEQQTLTNLEILQAIENTREMFDLDDMTFDTTTMKIPTIYPELNQEERNQKYSDLIWSKWEEHKGSISEDRHEEYVKEITSEVQIITSTNVSDYFLFNYELIKRSVERGGIITKSGRGSAVSFFTCFLLGFTSVDRISAKVKMYPERFLTADRIMTGSIPDIDFNIYGRDIFIEVQRELLGDDNSYWMMALTKLKEKSAFKVYAKSQDVPFDVSNAITKQLEKYEQDLKYAKDDEDIDGDTHVELDVHDYIDPEYHTIYDDSKRFIGIIDAISPHPCAFLVTNQAISSQIGVIRVKDNLVCLIEGSVADDWGYVKNDLLNVSVYGVIGATFKRLGKPIISAQELLDITAGDEKVWNIYRDGYTMCLNQVEQPGARKHCTVYQPKNISELTALIAGIRPSFKTMLGKLIKRESFDYGIPVLDKLLATDEMPDSFVLYQEQIMSVLAFAGFAGTETYPIIKAISKKKLSVIQAAQAQFVKNFTLEIMESSKGTTIEQAEKASSQVWQIIEDSSAYGFNASHAYCTAIDSLYGAYLKAHFPYEFYEACSEFYADKKENDKVSLIVNEMERGFDIKMGVFEFGLDNRKYTTNKEERTIYPSLMGVKYINNKIADILWEAGQEKGLDTFYDIYNRLISEKDFNKRHMETLMKIGYFHKFGKPHKLVRWMTALRETFKNKQYSKEKVDQRILDVVIPFAGQETAKLYKDIDQPALYNHLFNILPESEYQLGETFTNEVTLTGKILTDIPSGMTVGEIIARSWKKDVFLFKSWKNGAESWINAYDSDSMPGRGDITLLYGFQSKEKKMYGGGKRTDYWAEVLTLKKGKK